MKRIDLHIHTFATKYDRRGFEFDPAVLQAYVERARLDAIAITNHNVFHEATYVAARDAVGIPVFPGIEINVTKPGSYGHVLVIARQDDIDEFKIGAKKIEALFEDGCDHVCWARVVESFSNINNYLIIPHYRKKDRNLDDITLKEIRESSGIDALEVSTAKKWLREQEAAPETLVMFSDSRPGEQLPGREDNPTIEHYAYGFTYLRCDEMTVPVIKLALKDSRNANVFDEENDFEILPEGVPVSKRVNVLVGKRSTGKTFTLERIMDSLDQGDYAYIKQFGITEGAVDANFKKNSDQEDDAFAESHFSAVQDMLTDYLACADDHKSKVCDFCEAVVTFAKSPEDTCSLYPIYTAQAFSTESISNQIQEDFELMKASRRIRLCERRSEIVEATLGEAALEAFEAKVEEAAWAQFVEMRRIELADNLRTEIQEGLKAFSAREPLPEVGPLREYLKESYREQKLAEVLDELKKAASIESKPEGNFKRVRTRMAVTGATEARRRAKGVDFNGFDLKTMYAKTLSSRDQLRRMRGLPAGAWATAWRLLFKIESTVVNNDADETPLSGGQRAEYVFVHEIEKAKEYDYVFIDEPESSFDNEFLMSDIAKMIDGIAARSTVFLVTHNNTLGVSIHPDRVLYTVKDGDDYRLYSGDLKSSELTTYDGEPFSRANALLLTMEAGRSAYDDRKDYYETA